MSRKSQTFTLAIAMTALLFATARADTIINLSAGNGNGTNAGLGAGLGVNPAPTPNSDFSGSAFNDTSGGNPAAYNPVLVSLDAGSYSVSVIGSTVPGAFYDAWTIYAPTPDNGAFTAGFHAYLADGTRLGDGTGANYNTAAEALAAYQAHGPLLFSIATAQTVAFVITDSGIPYFADDSGGVSLRLTEVPEPASLAVLGVGMLGAGLARRRRAA